MFILMKNCQTNIHILQSYSISFYGKPALKPMILPWLPIPNQSPTWSIILSVCGKLMLPPLRISCWLQITRNAMLDKRSNGHQIMCINLFKKLSFPH